MANTLMKNDPATNFYLKWYKPYTELNALDQAMHKLSRSDVYRRYELAKRYGKQLYNRYGGAFTHEES